MPTYLGWNVVTIPTSPPAPASIEFTQIDNVAISVSPFTGQQQTQDWQATYMEASVSLPPLTYAQAQAWVTFLRNLKGVAGVFQFGSAFTAAYSADLGTRYWRLKSNARKWSVTNARLYGIQFDVREAL
jgi:hypothetical protein